VWKKDFRRKKEDKKEKRDGKGLNMPLVMEINFLYITQPSENVN
jgi:hypothetical protein